MGHRHDDDDDESIWDALMKPASMDYNFDGKIDDLDLYIEMDELNKALGRGKYDYYNDPYVIAEREREAAKKREDDNNDGDSDDDFDEEAFMNEVPDFNLHEDDDDEDDGYDDEDEIMDDLYDSDISHNDTSSEKAITLEFSFYDKSEDERKKFPITGIWQYFSGHSWKFIHALFTYDKQLKEDCGTTYDESEERIGMVLNEIYQFDKERAIADWDWLLKTFPAKTLNTTNEYSYDDPFSCQLGISVFSYLYYKEGNNKLLTEYIKQDYVFKYLVVDSVWEKHNKFYLSELLSCYAVADCSDLFKKSYETVLKTQKDCYSKKDLAEAWGYFSRNMNLADLSDELKNYIKSEIAKIGDFGKPVLKTIAEIEEEIEEHRRWEEEERLEAEQEAAEAEERRLEEEREAAERAEREQQIKILEEMSEPICTKILSGEYYDEAYKSVDQQFEYCFGSSRRTYDTVARYILGKNGEIKDINKDLQVGVISSKDIKNIFMLTSIGNDILNYNHVKYGGKMPESKSDKKKA